MSAIKMAAAVDEREGVLLSFAAWGASEAYIHSTTSRASFQILICVATQIARERFRHNFLLFSVASLVSEY